MYIYIYTYIYVYIYIHTHNRMFSATFCLYLSNAGKKSGCARTSLITDLPESQDVSLPQECLMFQQYYMSLYRRNFNCCNLWTS